VKIFSRPIIAAALLGFMLLPDVAFGQAQSIGSGTRLAPLDITDFYVTPLVKSAQGLTRHRLLIADPFKGRATDTAKPLIVVTLLPSTCAADQRCP